MNLLEELATTSSADLVTELDSLVDCVSDRADSRYLRAQRLLYILHISRWQPPWEALVPAASDTAVGAALERLSEAWHRAQTAGVLAEIEVPEARDFGDWLVARCRNHASGPAHPLFDFLENDATATQLREFVFQETPFDIHFGDLVAALLCGIYGPAKVELAHNFWDEMGNGAVSRTHRQLRINMMGAVGIEEGAHAAGLERFWVEELELANMYLGATLDRRLMAQALGMLLATEHVVPGRIDRQIKGWIRVGYAMSDLEYLAEHVTVDVEHAEGWLVEVIEPIIAAHPELVPEIVAGVERRLAGSLSVCDTALQTLPGTR